LNAKSKEKPVIEDESITDDVTVDTTSDIELTEDEQWEIPPKVDYDSMDVADYDLDDMYGVVLKGYIEYMDNDEILLSNIDLIAPSYNIKQPSKIEGKIFKGLKSDSIMNNRFSKFDTMPEYSITPVSAQNTYTKGGFSAGTSYGQWIYSGELEQASGVFSGYRYKNFYIQASYVKTVNSTNNDYNNNIYFSPEYKINQYITLKQRFSTDTVTKRKRAELGVALNPFGMKDPDRLSIEFSAAEIFSEDNAFLKNQFKVSTNFKL
jgi:hypothetical protein